MDVTNSLLVAMMFVMVLSIGIGNLLMGLSALVDRHSAVERSWLTISWLVLLLLQHFHLFWQTLAILDVEDWVFGSFIYVVTGPILLFLATSLMLPDPAEPGSGSEQHYFQIAPQFFFLLVALMVWLISVDVVLGDGMAPTAAWDGVHLLIFLGLAMSSQRRVHIVGTGVTGALFVALLALRGSGAVG